MMVSGVGCGDERAMSPTSASNAPSETTISVAPLPSTIRSPSASTPALPTSPAAAASADDVFKSTAYPYALTIPSNVVQVVWHPAERAWDGQEPIADDSPFTDRNGLVDGGIFVLGTRWTGSLKTFVSTVEQNVDRYHECRGAADVRSVKVGGASGTAWSHRCVDVLVARIAAVHGGWGLVASEMVIPEHEQGAVDRLAAWIGNGLIWRSP